MNHEKGGYFADQPVCGGTDVFLDEQAPKEIHSDLMIAFDVTSVLPEAKEPTDHSRSIGFVSAFAAPAGKGTFLFLETAEGFSRRDETSKSWALVKENIFPSLVEWARQFQIAKNNGENFYTNGLPENFGGQLHISYASGEEIRVSDNRSPVLSRKAGVWLADHFAAAMEAEQIRLPKLDFLREIRFSREREDGGFTKATLSLLPDGTGTNLKAQRFEDPHVCESEKPVNTDTILQIKRIVEENGVLAWSELPKRAGLFSEKKELVFRFEDGTEIRVLDDRLLPSQLRHAFFDIELELTVKH